MPSVSLSNHLVSFRILLRMVSFFFWPNVNFLPNNSNDMHWSVKYFEQRHRERNQIEHYDFILSTICVNQMLKRSQIESHTSFRFVFAVCLCFKILHWIYSIECFVFGFSESFIRCVYAARTIESHFRPRQKPLAKITSIY